MAAVFAYAAHAASTAHKKLMKELLAIVGKRAGIEITARAMGTYPELATFVDAGGADIAWLPPISFVLLEERGKIAPLVSSHRGGRATFHSVLLVRSSSSIQSLAALRGTRAAWVDKHSASGFVLPRIELAKLGIDPRTAFADERFYESHEAVVRAVVGDKADFAATYARLDRTGAPVRGAWMDLLGAEATVRVLTTFGTAPSDVIVARRDLDEGAKGALRTAFIGATSDVRGILLLRDLFGVDEFRPWSDAGYAALRRRMLRAAAAGLLDVAAPPSRKR